jgi:Ca2+/Na+ antiporter
LGNVIGSSISNILGAFALGLLFHSGRATFDRSSKLYTAILLAVTTIFVLFLAVPGLTAIAGPTLIVLFVIYVLSISYGIYKGAMSAPEDSDSDSDSDSEDEEEEADVSDSDCDDDTPRRSFHKHNSKQESRREPRSSVLRDLSPDRHSSDDEESSASTVTLLDEHRPLAFSTHKKPPKPHVINKRPKSMYYHILQLILGFLALSVSCFVLSHAIGAIGDSLGLSNSVVGVTIMSLATTLPEKFLAILGGARGQTAIVVANTAGSNIFLLTLCAGILFCSGDHDAMMDNLRRSWTSHAAELGIAWASAAALLVAVLLGADRRLGVVMLVLYIAFLVAEFTVFE